MALPLPGRLEVARSDGQRDAGDALLATIEAGTARVGVIGLGYVGLPLALEFAKKFATVGIDVDARRVRTLMTGRSHVGDVSDDDLGALVASDAFRATTDFESIASCDCIVICVPTPLRNDKQPDMSYILAASRSIAACLRPGQLVVLESTTYPGTTDDVLLPMFQQNGLLLDEDFFLAFSPERVDPGNTIFTIPKIPKVVGGCSPRSTELACALYGRIVQRVHPVTSARVAETSKLWENTFRAVNIALANEMAMICGNLGIDTSEVIEAAATKPFGFIPFYPGPGVGGHCIPLDPHYLSFSSSKHGYSPRFIRLADEINSDMANYVVALVAGALNDESRSLRGARVLVLGVSYKADIDDVRMSPAIPIIERLWAKGARVRYHDSFVPELKIEASECAPAQRRDLRAISAERRRRSDGLTSQPLTHAELADADCVLIVTAHSDVDYEAVMRSAKTIVDTRNVIRHTREPGDAAVITL